MASTVYRERSQDSVIVLSDSDGEKEEKCLKIHYQESLEFLEIPIENDGRISLEDVISMDPKIFALIIQKDGCKKLVKPKNGYWKEPKEKWKNCKVFAALKNQSERVELNSNSFNQNFNPNTNAAFNWNKKIGTPTFLPESPQNNCEFGRPSTSSSPSNFYNRVNNRDIKGETSMLLPELPENNVVSDYASTPASPFNPHEHIHSRNIESETSTILTPLHQNIIKAHHSSPSYLSSNNSLTEGFAQVLTPVNKCAYDEVLSDEYGNCINAVEEPTIDQILSAYKVSSLDELKYVLCRGDDVYEYADTSSILISRFKRTLAAYPNNEIVRIFEWAKTSNILMKDLDSTVKEYCRLCKKPLTLEHLISKKHAKKFHKKYNADPPEIAKLLEPEIYKQFIDPTILTSMNIPGFKKMEESPEFSVKESSKKTVLIKLKYILIRRILQANLRINNKNDFSVAKLLFLQKNLGHQYLLNSFGIENLKCQGCKNFPRSFHLFSKQTSCDIDLANIEEYNCKGCQCFPRTVRDFINHIFSEQHLQDCLNQEELNGICKAMSYLEQTSGGFRFFPLPNDNRKRQQISSGVKRGKRHKKS